MGENSVLFSRKRNRKKRLAGLILLAISVQACGGASDLVAGATDDTVSISEADAKRRIRNIANKLRIAATGSTSTTIPTTTTSSPSTATSNPSTTISSTSTTTSTTSPIISTTMSGAVPVVTVSVDGVAKTPVDVDVITTRSGDWLLQDLGAYQDVQVYLMKLSSNPNFVRAFACRRSFTAEAGDSTALSIVNLPVTIKTGSTTYQWNLGLAQGACRVAQNIEPVAPNAQWLRDAVAERRVPSYRRETAWAPGLLKVYAPSSNRGPYDSSSLGPVPGDSTAVPTASNNYVGTTSGQGGEYSSSRGFLHNVDAGIIDLALHFEDSSLIAVWPEFSQHTLYSLAQPQGAVWSSRLHVTVDPQIPQAGEIAWEIGDVGPNTNAGVNSLRSVINWSRDPSHLENTGYIHWVLTEDPVAGLVVQRQAAYSMASYYEYRRSVPMGNYRAFDEQERGIYNALSALWKSRDVSARIASKNGTFIWSLDRVNKQSTDIISYFDSAIYQPVLAALPGSSDLYAKKLASAGLANTFIESMNTPSGSVGMSMMPNFMLPQYGKEPLYLWAKMGNSIALKWLETAAIQTKVRLVDIGGAAGVDACVGVNGSSFPLKIANSVPSFSDSLGWAAWVRSICPSANTISFDGAQLHTAMQMEGLLMFARDAGVTNLDSALSTVATMRSNTTLLKWPDIQSHKHLARPSN
jgi:hypothetical protein